MKSIIHQFLGDIIKSLKQISPTFFEHFLRIFFFYKHANHANDKKLRRTVEDTTI